MSELRNVYNPAWCSACMDMTLHDEAGHGICAHCMRDMDKWIESLKDDVGAPLERPNT